MGTAQTTDIFTSLKERIIHYELRPRERLTEAGLAAQYGLSRTPVREALRKLEQEGWVVLIPHQGYYVRDFSVKELDDIYEVRIALERFAVRLAAERMGAEQYADLHAFWGRPEPAQEIDNLAMLRADESFHESIARATGNGELLRALRSINERIRIIRRIDFTDPERIRQTYQQHLRILELLHRRDAAAEEAMEAHIRESKATIIRLAREGLGRIYLKNDAESG